MLYKKQKWRYINHYFFPRVTINRLIYNKYLLGALTFLGMGKNASLYLARKIHFFTLARKGRKKEFTLLTRRLYLGYLQENDRKVYLT